MRLVEKFALPLALAGFFAAGTGCMEEEQKARERGTNINQSLHKDIDKAKDIVGSATDNLKQLEEDLGEAKEE